jgi:hypothetical protein
MHNWLNQPWADWLKGTIWLIVILVLIHYLNLFGQWREICRQFGKSWLAHFENTRSRNTFDRLSFLNRPCSPRAEPDDLAPAFGRDREPDYRRPETCGPPSRTLGKVGVEVGDVEP